ncbi:MAG TPA: methyltransferase domain-containing protein [Bacillota bacterium]|nr:methyltransferase domain-containing protein [Bacillota bacterium]
MDKILTETIKRRYNRISTIFDWMDRMIKNEWRMKTLSQVSGNVLEVGVGTGANLSFYPKGITMTGIDFSPGMLRFAHKKAYELNLPVKLLEMDAQQMEFADNSFDYVVATCVYCSVPDPIAGLKEMRRVCKPGGKVLLLEHMRSDHPVLGWVMDRLNPITVSMYGANINRRTIENIKKAGFIIVEEEKLMGSIMRRLTLSPNK